jgi:hypothetical protein
MKEWSPSCEEKETLLSPTALWRRPYVIGQEMLLWRALALNQNGPCVSQPDRTHTRFRVVEHTDSV